MKFLAHINPKSSIHQLWRGENRINGIINTVLFKWNNDLRRYEAGEISADLGQEFLLRQDKAVTVETLAVMPDIEPIEEVVPEPIPVIPIKVATRRRLQE